MRYLIYILIACSPLPLASARPIWAWLWCCYVGIAVFIVFFQNRARSRMAFSPQILLPCLTMGILCVWGFLQAIITHWLGYPSIDEPGTIATSTYFLSHIVWFAIVASTCASARIANDIVTFIARVSVAYALYGLLVYFTGNKSILWFEKWAYLDSLTSTFVNRNSYAAFCGIGIQTLTASFFYKYENLVRQNFAPKNILAFVISNHLSYTWGFCILLTALMLTGSRAGIATVFVALLFHMLFAVSLIHSRNKFASPSGSRGAVILFFAAIMAAMFSMNGAQLQKRVSVDISSDERFVVYGLITEAIADRPITGYGLGSFEEAFKLYRTPEVKEYFDRGHNDYLELAMTAGLPATFVFLLGLFAVLWSLARSLRTSNSDISLVILGLASSLQIGLHSAIDFSMQIPAVSYTFATVLAVCFAVTLKSTR